MDRQSGGKTAQVVQQLLVVVYCGQGGPELDQCRVATRLQGHKGLRVLHVDSKVFDGQQLGDPGLDVRAVVLQGQCPLQPPQSFVVVLFTVQSCEAVSLLFDERQDGRRWLPIGESNRFGIGGLGFVLGGGTAPAHRLVFLFCFSGRVALFCALNRRKGKLV